MPVKQVFSHYERGGELPRAYRYCPSCGLQLSAVEIDHKPRAACPACGFVHFAHPAPTVSVVILDGDRVLLGRRGGHPGKGTWSFPSGYIEYEDDFLSTAVREAKEETGLDVEIGALVNVISSFVSPKFHFLGLYVTGRVVGGELEAGDDLEAVGWFPLSEPLPEMGFQEDVEVLRMAVSDRLLGLPIDPRYASQRSSGWEKG